MESQNLENTTVSYLWGQFDFNGKHWYDLNSNDELCLKPHFWNPRSFVICKLHSNTFDATLHTLIEKFTNIQQDFDALETEWKNTTEPYKLNGRYEKLKDYILHSKAVGNIIPILETIKHRFATIQEALAANYKARLDIVEKAEALQHSTDFKTTHQSFKDLLEAWKAAPPVEKNKLDALWQRIENARQHFFEIKRAQQEDLEKQLMANLDLKLELCEKAEALANSTDWKTTTELFKELTEAWKQIGRVVSVEKNDELWNRFISAQNSFFNAKRNHFEIVQHEQEENARLKEQIINTIESIDIENCNWKETADKVSQLTEEWKTIGRVPKEKSDEMWNRLQEAKTRFYNAKRKYGEQVRISLEDNLAKKQALLNRIEKIKNSNQWRETTIEINALLDEWKSIGPIPRDLSNKMWEQFIQARNVFFDRKDKDRETRQQLFFDKLESRIAKTVEFLAKLEAELVDDHNKIAEFTENAATLQEGNAKDMELKTHLISLIENIQQKIPARKRKIEEVTQQLAELEAMKKKQMQHEEASPTADTDN